MRISDCRPLNFYAIDVPVFGTRFIISSLPLCAHDPHGQVTVAVTPDEELVMHPKWHTPTEPTPDIQARLRASNYGFFDESLDITPQAKYICFRNEGSPNPTAFLLFPAGVEHQQVMRWSECDRRLAVSAGFVELNAFGIRCTGESWSMATGTDGPVRSRGPEDAAFMRERLGMGR